MNAIEKAAIKLRTGWSSAIIDYIGSREEAEIYIRAGLKEATVGDRKALIRTDIDWRDFSCRHEWLKKYIAGWDKLQDWNNADLIGEGFPPRDKNGDPYELHHIGQHQDSPFAELTYREHMQDGNNAILHPVRESEIDRQQFEKEKCDYWKSRFKRFTADDLKRIYG